MNNRISQSYPQCPRGGRRACSGWRIRVRFPPRRTHRRYVFAAWIPAEDRIGLPLHVLDDGDIVQSFGIVPGQDSVTDYYTAERRLSTDGSWDVFAVPYG